ncbi:hypothetical protein QL285_011971 [Trifolium repens]|nr:hypothetical protein QL285_011971 [Trifolium repens]
MVLEDASGQRGLWYRVLAARYRWRQGEGWGSLWWREIVMIRDGVGGQGGGWFRESVVRQVGDGVETFFLTDPWLDGSHLCERFGRMFDLAANKSCSIVEMYSLGWEVGGGARLAVTVVSVGGGDVWGVSTLPLNFSSQYSESWK